MSKSRESSAKPLRGFRRWLVRILFVALGFVPFAGLLGWSLYRELMLGTGYFAQQSLAYLGLIVELDRVRRPVPWETVLEDVRIRGAESEEYVAQAPRLRIHYASDEVRVLADSVSIRRGHWPVLWRVFQERLLSQPLVWAPIMGLDCGPLRIEDAQGAVTVQLHQAELRREKPLTRAEIRFGPDEDPQSAATLVIERHGDLRASVTRVELDAERTEVPLVLLHGSSLADELLGRDVGFRGRINCEFHPSYLEGEIVGRLQHVQLQRLAELLLAESLEGEAEITIVQASWRAGKLRALDLILTADAGQVTGKALESAARRYHLKVDPTLRNDPHWLDRRYEFDKLAFRIQLTAEMLDLQPLDLSSGVIMASRGQPYLSAVNYQLGVDVSPWAVCYHLEQLFRSLPR